MNPQQFIQLLIEKQAEIEQAWRRTLPVKIGRIAQDHFQDNFRKHGFVDGGTHPWQRTRRQGRARGAAGQYGPLMSDRQHLYGSISYQPADAAVTIGTSVPYAAVHNEGGGVVVTARMKRYFWARFREANGNAWARKQAGPEAELWKAMALKPAGSVIHIPRRQFIGESRELNEKVDSTVTNEIARILQL